MMNHCILEYFIFGQKNIDVAPDFGYSKSSKSCSMFWHVALKSFVTWGALMIKLMINHPNVSDKPIWMISQPPPRYSEKISPLELVLGAKIVPSGKLT